MEAMQVLFLWIKVRKLFELIQLRLIVHQFTSSVSFISDFS